MRKWRLTVLSATVLACTTLAPAHGLAAAGDSGAPASAALSSDASPEAAAADSPSAELPAAPDPQGGTKGPAPSNKRFGAAVVVSTLGVGGEFAYRVRPKINVRAEANFFSLSHAFSEDGTNYDATVHLQSVSGLVDYFFYRDIIHVSGGVMAYNGNNLSGNAGVPPGATFTLNGTQYTSSLTNPVTGTMKIQLGHVAPEVLIGWGNLIPRAGRRWAIEAEAGIAYAGSPATTLNLGGSACLGTSCFNPSTNPAVQANVVGEQNIVNHDLHFFQILPIITVSASYSF